MPPSVKMDILNRIYRVYDRFSSGLTLACARGCAACCTQNVTMTTLEGNAILSHLASTEKLSLLERLCDVRHQNRFKPFMSTNQLAALCIRGENPPDEANHWSRASCPFLSDNECLIYEARPFGCRCFVSQETCDVHGSAVVDPFVLSVNMAFLQVIEHVDAGGLFGNMTDVLFVLRSEACQCDLDAWLMRHGGVEAGRTEGCSREELAVNRPMPGLLVPPEHQSRIRPILLDLERIGITRA